MSTNMNNVSICAVCETCPEGQKLTAVILEYDEMIDGASLQPQQFEVKGRAITTACTADKAKLYARTESGHFIILSLSHNDLDADLVVFDGVGPNAKMLRKEPSLLMRQKLPIMTTSGKTLPAWDDFRPQDTVIEPVVQRFRQEKFVSKRTGQSLGYNICMPREYDPAKKYPLLLFIHDKGALSPDTIMALRQGIGATVWASCLAQQKHPCIVVAPQYEIVPEKDGDPDMLETTFDLMDDIKKRLPVDRARIYATGQSMGCISEIAMILRRPDYFSACYLVAGQWDGPQEEVLKLKDKKLFIVVSRGDPRAYKGMNETLAILEAHGGKIARAEWDQDGGTVPEEQVRELCAQQANIRYAVLKTEKRSYCCHMETWQVAYGIEGIRDWLFEQKNMCME